MKHFRDQEILFPVRLRTGARKGELVFRPLLHSRALSILHNPRYAGTFAYGRTQVCRRPDGSVRLQPLPRDQWQVLIPDAHAGYITWAEHEANLAQLRENARSHGQDRRRSPAREGPALLQGLVVCGLCGDRMTTQYTVRSDGTRLPIYVCQLRAVQRGEPVCQRVAGQEMDKAIGKLLVEAMTPLTLEVALSVDDELKARAEEVDRLRRQEVERTRYDAELAERRFRRVDPDHRLVADALEAEWNEKLRAHADAMEHYQQQQAADRTAMDEESRRRICRLATDFPRLWADPGTPHREKKRMVRLLLEDVTLIRNTDITVHIRFNGGATRTLTLPLPLRAPDLRRTDPKVVERVDQLLDDHTEAEVVELLNQEGCRTGTGLPFTPARLHDLRTRYGLRCRYVRLRERGLWTLTEMAQHLGVHPSTVHGWYKAGLLKAHLSGGPRSRRLYEPPGPNPRRPQPGKRLACNPPRQ